MNYDRIREIIGLLEGYFQFKSDSSEIAQKAIRLLDELKTIIRSDFEVTYVRRGESKRDDPAIIKKEV